VKGGRSQAAALFGRVFRADRALACDRRALPRRDRPGAADRDGLCPARQPSGEQRSRPIGSRRGGGEGSEQGLLRGARGARQWRGNGKGVGSYALRHVRRPALQNNHCRLGRPKEVLGGR